MLLRFALLRQAQTSTFRVADWIIFLIQFAPKASLSNQFQTEHVWQEFLKCVEERLKEEGYFQRIQGWQALWNAWSSNVEVNKLKRARLMLKILIQNPSARKAFLKRFEKGNLILTLAEQSRRIFSS